MTVNATSANKEEDGGTNKAVNVAGFSTSGTEAANYPENPTASTTANITAKALTVSATGVNKVYDGTTTATVTLSDNRVAGDVLTTAYATASFADSLSSAERRVGEEGRSRWATDHYK